MAGKATRAATAKPASSGGVGNRHPHAPPPKLGRPEHVPTEQDRRTVAVLVAGGVDQYQIAGVLGISRPALRKHYKSEIANGSGQVNAIVIAAHLKRIRAGDMRAIEWWQKARMGWAETQKIQPLGKDGQPTDMRVTVELVG